MYTGDIDILELLPQRPPFLMVDRLEDFEPEVSVSSFDVPQECLLARDGHLSEAGILENIAQSCAARIGYVNLRLRHESVKIGIIGSVKDLEICFLPEAGAHLVTTVRVLSEVFSITLVEAKVMTGDAQVASCQMKISLTDKEID